MPARLAAPVVVYLAHETCPLSGEALIAAGGIVSRVYLARTQGLMNRQLTAEDVAENLDQIMDVKEATLISTADRDAETNLRAVREVMVQE